MKYSAIVTPTEPGYALADHRLPDDIDKESYDGDGFRITCPGKNRTTERTAVKQTAVKRSSNERRTYTQVGTILTSNPDPYLDMEKTRLWLPHALFSPDAPLKINVPEAVVLYRDPEVEQGPAVFERRPVEGVTLPDGLLALTTRGAIYEETSEARPGLCRDLPALSVRQTVSPCDDSDHQVVLNPWTISCDTTVDHDGHELLDADIRRELIQLIDFHVDFARMDWLRVRLHTDLYVQWHRATSGMSTSEPPTIPRLMFGTGEPSPARARAFLVLDALVGRFSVDGFVSPTGFRWTPEPSTGFANHDWLITDSLRALALPAIARDGRSGVGREPSLHIHAHDDSGREVRLKSEDMQETKTLSEVFSEVFREQGVPEELVRLSDVCSGRITADEAEEVRTTARLFPDGNGVESGNFVQAFCRRHVVPLSPILVTLPAPPLWIGTVARSRWDAYRSFDPRLTDGTRASDGEVDPWWLDLLQPARSVELPDEWQVQNKWWKHHLRVALFRRPPCFKPRWAPPPAHGVLGRSRLGRNLLLGVSESLLVHGPWDPWPRILRLAT